MWYNPLTWIAALKELAAVLVYIKAIWTGVVSLVSWVKSLIIKKYQDKEVKEAEQAVQHLSDANQIANDDDRLKAKAEAACELEKAINPDSSC